MMRENKFLAIRGAAMMWALRVVIFAVTMNVFSPASGQSCGNLTADAGGYGPYDYRDPVAQREWIPRVEMRHFTSNVENLLSGNTSSTPGGDIDYTLRHIPNHHRALNSMMRLALRQRTDKPGGSRYTMQCWFARAHQFAPDDGIVWMIQGIYLDKKGKLEQAINAMQKGLEHEPRNPNIHYNLGLLYVKAGDYTKARKHADLAYQAGFPLQGLKRKLRQKGH
jgi:tetratricopeptide (TPR) repeat protein